MAKLLILILRIIMSNYLYMQKNGKYRAFRNVPVGWVLQALHSTDKSEMFFRIFLEIFVIIIVFLNCDCTQYGMADYFALFIVIHSFFWLVSGNFWVYILDSFLFFRNPGLKVNLNFVLLTQKFFNFFNCCEAILIYGSMCRGEFHNRSDLDLRVVRRRGVFYSLLCFIIAFILKFYSFIILLPADLQVVDSIGFLNKQMRNDENPIVVYSRNADYVYENGFLFVDVISSPSLVLKEFNIGK